ncbi:MAG: hypothetical protein KAS63_11320 [Candidatus Heimdallarchaeota archaeon]|nr:hypothetical protein [Candidatus Heimdallarchaeota archaeon]MCK4955947.1 hypothetical protein [Candidatus Heimdallarchaeota archaeon]
MKSLFVNERLKELANNRTPIKFLNSAKIVLHIIPDSSMLADQDYDIEIITRNPNKMEPIKAIGVESSHNYDGFLTYTTDISGMARSYVQLYKKGIMEAVEGSMLKPIVSRLEIPSIAYEEEIMRSLPIYIQVLRKLEINPPLSLFLSFVKIKGYTMKLKNSILGATPTAIEEDELKLSEIFIEDHSQLDTISITLKPWFDEVWNACGMFKSFNYDEENNWGLGLNMRE